MRSRLTTVARDMLCLGGIALVISCAVRQGMAGGATPAERAYSLSEAVPLGMDLASVLVLRNSGSPVLVDIRGPEEFAKFHLPGSIPMADALVIDAGRREVTAAASVSKGSRIVLVCGNGSCFEGPILAMALRKNGYDAHILTGGIELWKAAGLPLVASAEIAQK